MNTNMDTGTDADEAAEAAVAVAVPTNATTNGEVAATNTTTSMKICSYCGVANDDVHLRCSKCHGVYYCSKDCQKVHWTIHKKICKQVNVGEAQQVRHVDHTRIASFRAKAMVTMVENSTNIQQMFELYMTGDTSPATINKMKDLLLKSPKWERKLTLFKSLAILISLPSNMVDSPTSPIVIILQSGDIDPNTLSCPPPPKFKTLNDGSTPLHWLSEMADPIDPTTHINQVIIGRQLIDAGANVNATTEADLGYVTPLHRACHSGTVTNFDFIKLLLDNGADPNARSVPQGETPLMHTAEAAMPAARLLLTYPGRVAIDVNVRSANGSTFLGCIRYSLMHLNLAKLSSQMFGEQIPSKVSIIAKQMEDVERLLMDRNAIDGGWNNEYQPSPDTFSGRIRNMNPLTSDVEVLLDKDLLLRTTDQGKLSSDSSSIKEEVPDWYTKTPFWVDDSISMQIELFEKRPMLHTGYSNGKYSEMTKKPAVGQGIEITAKIPIENENLHAARLSGKVTSVGPEPSCEGLVNANSHLYNKACECKNPQCELTLTGKREDILRKFGCLHAQEVFGVVTLNPQDHSNEIYTDFFRGPTVKYNVVLRANDRKQNQWEVSRISLVKK